jgi:uncharacterized RDD family membrane protein YckC
MLSETYANGEAVFKEGAIGDRSKRVCVFLCAGLLLILLALLALPICLTLLTLGTLPALLIRSPSNPARFYIIVTGSAVVVARDKVTNENREITWLGEGKHSCNVFVALL